MRYAVLHHVGVPAPHFDLLFEMEEDAPALTTLRCPRWPVELGDELLELPEHRRAYLDYEGPISGDRGSVTRVAGGTIEVVELGIDPPVLGLRLFDSHGKRGDLSISHRFGDESQSLWTVTSIGT